MKLDWAEYSYKTVEDLISIKFIIPKFLSYLYTEEVSLFSVHLIVWQGWRNIKPILLDLVFCYKH